jgi:energy-coupling factor transporter ATP-binding protein EcfA2
MSQLSKLGRSAIDYSVLYNWKVIPLHNPIPDKPGTCSCHKGSKCESIGKHPRISQWQKLASSDHKQIGKWWTQWPEANIGLACGQSDIIAIDIDPQHEGCLSDLNLPAEETETLINLTGSGGQHLIYKLNGLHITNSSKGLPDGIDVRAKGGFVVLPPSNHYSGRAYQWDAANHPTESSPRSLPNQLKEKLLNSKTQALVKSQHNIPQIIPNGTRDNTLASMAGYMRQKFGANETEILGTLEAFNPRCETPLPVTELSRISKSMDKYESNGTIPNLAEAQKKKVLEKELRDNLELLCQHNKLGLTTKVMTMVENEIRDKDVKKREFILDPWLKEQSLTMIHGTRGIGKTQISIGIALAIAGNKDFLSWEATGQHNVLFIDGELPLEVLKTRIIEGRKHLGITEALPNLTFITRDIQEQTRLPNIATLHGQAQLDPIIENYDVVILDNLSSLASGIQENDAEAWEVMQTWLLDLRSRGKAVIFFHHENKGGGQRGTSKREDVLDVVMRLKHSEDYDMGEGAKFIIEFSKAREIFGSDSAPIEVELDNFEGWSYKQSFSESKQAIIDLYNEGKSQTEISKRLAVSKPYVSKIVNWAKKAQVVQ